MISKERLRGPVIVRDLLLEVTYLQMFEMLIAIAVAANAKETLSALHSVVFKASFKQPTPFE